MDAAQTASLQRAWKRVTERHPWRRHLPPEVGVIVDASWVGSAGYWAPSLHDSSGAPAIRIAKRVLRNEGELARVITHELTHMMEWKVRPRDEGWLREGLAMLAEYKVASRLNPSLNVAFEEPTTGLLEGLEHPAADFENDWHVMNGAMAKYGQALQFFLYFDRLCFDPRRGGLLTAAGRALERDLAGQEWLLSLAELAVPICGDFDALFTEFQRARFKQTFGSPFDYIIPTSVRAKSVPRPETRAALPLYSAASYFSEEACLAGEEDLPVDPSNGKRRCLRIRLGR